MPDGMKLGGAYVEISAEMGDLDRALDALPARMARKAGDAASAMRAQMARNKLELKDLIANYDKGPIPLAGEGFQYAESDKKIQALIQSNAALAAKLGLIEGAVVRKAAAMRGDTAATASASEATQRYAASAGAAAAKTQTLHTGMAGIQGGAKNAGYGLLMFSQMVDDMQYGFRSVVNNIPGVVYSLTGSQGLGGALALAGVGVNTWIQNWDEAKDAFGDTSAFKGAADAIKSVGDAALTAGASILHMASTPMATEDVTRMANAKAEKLARGKAAGAAAGDVRGVGKEGDSERASSFREAIEKAGGGKGLIEQMHSAQIASQGGKAGGAEQQKKQKDNIALLLKSALSGDAGAIGEASKLSPSLSKAYAQTSPEAKAEAKFQKEAADEAFRQKKHDEEEYGREVKRRNKEIDDEHKKRVEELARVAAPQIGKLVLDNPNASLQAPTGNALARAGATRGMDPGYAMKLAAEVGEKVRKDKLEGVRDEALKTGLTPEQASKKMLAEQLRDERDKAKADAKAEQGDVKHSERLTTDQYLNKIQAAALSPEAKTQAEMLREQREANKHLVEIAQNVKPAGKRQKARFG